MRLATAVPEGYRTLVSADDEPPAPDPAEADATPEGADDAAGPVDQLGIPMSREPTLDDVRSDGVEHRRLALGCTLLVALLLVGFFVLRVVVLR
ncbi:MAG: hypothetical protein FJ095_17060 [Deltaproteobacteria bacterium]|nr:hypothetical protein [Deltaproteobacteria bacterium]